MQDRKKMDILNEIRSIIGEDIYKEMKEGRKLKKKEKKSRLKRKRKRKVDRSNKKDKRNEKNEGDKKDEKNEGDKKNEKNEGDKKDETNEKDEKEMCKDKKDLEEEKEEKEVGLESGCYIKNRKRKYNEQIENNDDHCKNKELQDKSNVKKKCETHNTIENWGISNATDNVCKYYFLKGRCKHGENCFYSHDVTPLYKMSKLCKFQLKGKCKKKHCPFSHDPNMFYCRNELIGGSCKNPSCLFKHVALEVKFKDQKSRNIELGQILTKVEKNLFVFNNKSFIMNILIRNYCNFNSLDDVNLNEINKNENYPWYINCAIDLLKQDMQQNKTDYFYNLIYNYLKEKAQNILYYIDDEKLKLQVKQEMLLDPTSEDIDNNIQQKDTQQTEIESNTVNVESQHLQNVHLKNEDIKNEDIKNKDIKNEHIKSKDIQSKDIQSNDIQSNDIQSNDIQSKDIQSSNNETDSSLCEYKVFSSDEDDDYSKYLNKYLKIST